jgi:hypothetical protein
LLAPSEGGRAGKHDPAVASPSPAPGIETNRENRESDVADHKHSVQGHRRA